MRTDHQAIKFLQSSTNYNSRLVRWGLKLQEITFDIEYIRGDNNYSDCLSRPPVNINIRAIKIANDPIIQKKILNQYHLFSGHGRAETMKFLIKNEYEWNIINKGIELLVQSCAICQRSNGSKINTRNMIIEPKGPNELWVCDLIGKLQLLHRETIIYLWLLTT